MAIEYPLTQITLQPLAFFPIILDLLSDLAGGPPQIVVEFPHA
jgi:hypothetical protein